MKGSVLAHDMRQKVGPQGGGHLLDNIGERDFLPHSRDGAASKNTEDSKSDPLNGRLIARNKHGVKHRAHDVAERAQHRAFEDHKHQRNQQIRRKALKIAAPKPAKQFVTRI